MSDEKNPCRNKLSKREGRGARLARREEGTYPAVRNRRETPPGGMDRPSERTGYSGADSDPGRLHRDEAAFHDAWSGSVDPASVQVRPAFEAPTAPEHRFILERMGPLQGRRVLDVGCGLGEAAVYFALQGARVTAADVSPGMVDAAARLARHHGVELEGVVTPAEELAVDPGSFDIVYLGNLIHHVHERDALFRRVRDALRPGGVFFSWDPILYNPAIMVYRLLAASVRTPDEKPLTFADLEVPRRYFKEVGHREFWIASLALFFKYWAIDRVDPGEVRYWKRILQETDESLRWWRPLAAADQYLTRLPLLRRLAWNMVIWGTR